MKTQCTKIAVVASCGAETEMFRHAGFFSVSKDAVYHRVLIPGFAVPEDDALAVSEIRRLAEERKLDLIISEWLGHTRAMQDLIHLAQEREIPAVFVRTTEVKKVRRVVVATGGGPNLYEQMWLARETASDLGVPVEILHWTPDFNDIPIDGPNDNGPLEKMCVHLLNMQVDTIHCSGTDFAGSVACSLRPDDLLIVGAPSPLRLVADFAGSLPDQLAKRIPNPLILLSSPPLGHISLRRLLWGKLIKPRLRSRSKNQALESMVDNLIRHNQLPPTSQKDILTRALEREQISSTAVDCETAFPHVKLPGFFGVAGTLGIFPDGIDFGHTDGHLTRFVFLLVTPDGFCDEYLAFLSKISKRMLNSSVREALLRCKTAAEAVEILEPHEDFPYENSALVKNYSDLKSVPQQESLAV
ncbi:PTS sugar transporter subunit IIA [Pontiellaceae bacterium B12219]|nr:PTS sugar transporter subunit IIA [Pontiellaceae bacterium B12219]